eukprot:TRINITY_DN3563_c0_g1_i1.p1 TRINITY_DN3563_c0_g1~~TRINITY_DN3563_c0_g1_i1.p1  ORF type:complete len:165 (-),score=21.25 TRINITY_DN3563_c0_g1_i1:540-1034(-)
MCIRDRTQSTGVFESFMEGSLLSFKLQSAAIIGIVAFLGGIVPLKYNSPKLLSLGNTFSGGIFLSAGFIHMLEESVHGFQELGMTDYPYPYICCVIGILIPLFVEKILLGEHGHGHGHKLQIESDTEMGSSPYNRVKLNMLMLTTMLSIHSLIEGLCKNRSIFL